jgi:hypothetical protein
LNRGLERRASNDRRRSRCDPKPSQAVGHDYLASDRADAR